MKSYKISGEQAIRVASAITHIKLEKSADPVEGFRDNITIFEAREIVKIDPSLISCTVVPVGWVGDSTGKNVDDFFRGNEYLGPDDDNCEPIWENA